MVLRKRIWFASMRELKTTQKMRYEKVILAIVLAVLVVAVWLIMVR